MAEQLKICVDRVLPRDLNRPRRMRMIGDRLSAIIEFRKLWINGSTLHVRFMGGTAEQQQLVKEQAKWWIDHANLKFEFDNAEDAEIRISFNPGDGAWSYVGTDCKSIPMNQATMNLGFLDGGTAAHELGHAIGLGHEHQNPEGGIQWNEAEVIKDLSGPPNYWTVQQIRHNVLNKYSVDQIRGTEFDPDSIMLYAFPARWTTNNVGTKGNDVLSELDQAFISGADAYPGLGETVTEIVQIPVIDMAATPARIGQPGEEDLFRFTAADGGRYTIETGGQTDVVMKLFGPDSQTQLISEDDDGGAGFNAKIVADLVAGNYILQVRHYNESGGTGDYTIKVSK